MGLKLIDSAFFSLFGLRTLYSVKLKKKKMDPKSFLFACVVANVTLLEIKTRRML